MSLEESSVLMDRALVTICQGLPESLGLYNTAKDQLALAAIRAVPLLEHVGSDSRKLALIRDWMRTFEPAEDQPLGSEIDVEALKEMDKREREKLRQELQREKHAQKAAKSSEKKKRRKVKKKENSSERERGKTAKKRKEEKKTVSKRTRKRHDELSSDEDDEDDVIDESSSSSNDSSAETSSSSESDSDSRARKRKKINEVVLSSDEDEEPNDMFDTDDPDVYEVEKILRKKTSERYGEPDLYEVKWEGYEETTWEPASNISKDLIDEFEGQPVREDVYTVEEIVDRRSKRDETTKLKTHEYKVKWVGYDELTWEPAENLPHNMRRKFDQKYEIRKRRRS